MSPASLTARIFRDQALGIGEQKLVRGEVQGGGRNLSRIFEKDAEHPQRSELDGHAEAIVIATMGRNESAISVVEMEITRQLIRGKLAGKAAIFPHLAFVQKPDRHGLYTATWLSRFARRLLVSNSFARSRGFPLAST